MRKFLKILFFVAVLGIVVFFMFHSGRNSGFFDPLRSFFTSLMNAHTFEEKITALTLENQSLRNEISALKKKTGEVSVYHYKTAAVYSRYPSNDRSLVVISLGVEDGIAPGMPVMVREGVLFGKIKSVARTQSEVETIFSPQWKSSVNIGSAGAKAVLQGGAIPSLELISKEESIRDGENVSNIASEFPLGVLLGTLQSLGSSSNDVWQHGTLALPYEIQDVASVLVLVDFP